MIPEALFTLIDNVDNVYSTSVIDDNHQLTIIYIKQVTLFKLSLLLQIDLRNTQTLQLN